MSGILVFAEHEAGSFKKTAYELLGKGAQLAAALGVELQAVVLGDAPASELGAFGAKTVYQVTGVPAAYSTAATVDGLAAAAAAAQPDVILAAASFAGKDALPRLVARLGTGMGSECTDLVVERGQVVARRPLYAGKVYGTVEISKKPAIFSVRPNSFAQPSPGAGAANVVAIALQATTPTVEVVERKQPDSHAADLTEADRIVSGGRSLKSAEQFDAVIRPLAAALGATVGASRAAVDAGYAHHNEQVGQTGKTVNATVYIAAGISGAIQHLAGMRTSKVIVAINKDPEAPIFEHATYGLVGDLFEICPKLQAEFKAQL